MAPRIGIDRVVEHLEQCLKDEIARLDAAATNRHSEMVTLSKEHFHQLLNTIGMLTEQVFQLKMLVMDQRYDDIVPQDYPDESYKDETMFVLPRRTVSASNRNGHVPAARN